MGMHKAVMITSLNKKLGILTLLWASTAMAQVIDVQQLQLEIASKKKSVWRAVKNKFTEMTPEQRKNFLGAPPLVNPKPLRNRSELSPQERSAILPRSAEPGSLSTKLKVDPNSPPDHAASADWRGTGLSEVKNQGSCGTCVPFATSSTLQDQLKIRSHLFSGHTLSPQFLFSCSNGTCAGGTIFQTVATFVLNYGAVPEECVPYQGQESACTVCNDWQNQGIKFNHMYRNGSNTTVQDLAEVIYNQGPVLARMAVYSDFFAYSGGIYSHVSGDQVGSHGVEIVGYDKNEQYWIARNSWGAEWGEGGYFKIAFGDASAIASESWQFWPL